MSTLWELMTVFPANARHLRAAPEPPDVDRVVRRLPPDRHVRAGGWNQLCSAMCLRAARSVMAIQPSDI